MGKAERKTTIKMYGHHQGDTRANGMEEKDVQDRWKCDRAIQQDSEDTLWGHGLIMSLGSIFITKQELRKHMRTFAR